MYLVTGGAGFIGSNIAAALGRVGHRVVINDTLGHEDKWKNIAKREIYDFVHPPDLDAWLAKHGGQVAGVIHMGAISATTERDSDLIVASNFSLSLKLWDWCAARQVPFIYASSAATYGDGAQGFSDDMSPAAQAALRPLNPYGWSKLAFDRRVLRAVADGEPTPAKWAGLKFFNVYGPNEYHKGSMRSVLALNHARLAAGEPLALFRSYRPDYADGEQKRDFVYVKDCVAVIQWMLENPFTPGIFNVGSGEAKSWLQLGKAAFAALDLPERINFIEMPESLRTRYQYITLADISRLREIGYVVPMHTLDEGVSDYYRNYLSTSDPYE